MNPNRQLREEVIIEAVPEPERVTLIHEGLAPNCTLEVVVDGKKAVYILSRRLVFGLMAQTAKALHEMEPGKWVSPY